MEKCKIKPGWGDAGKTGTVLGKNIFVEQAWTPVKWDDEEDPDWFKSSGLMFFEENHHEIQNKEGGKINMKKYKLCAATPDKLHSCEENVVNTKSDELAAKLTTCEICGEPRPNKTQDALIKLGWCGANIDAETKTHKIKRAVTFCPKHGPGEVSDCMIKLILGDNMPTPNIPSSRSPIDFGFVGRCKVEE